MAKFDYINEQATANRLIERYGASGSFTHKENGAIDPATGEQSPATETMINGTVTPVLSYKKTEINGESVLMGDGYVYFDGGRVSVDDTTIINSDKYRCVAVDKIESVDGILVYQKLQLRK